MQSDHSYRHPILSSNLNPIVKVLCQVKHCGKLDDDVILLCAHPRFQSGAGSCAVLDGMTRAAATSTGKRRAVGEKLEHHILKTSWHFEGPELDIGTF